MLKYKVQVPFSKYVRGTKEFDVVADSPEEAISKARDYEWDEEHMEVVRDDTDTEWREAEAMEV